MKASTSSFLIYREDLKRGRKNFKKLKIKSEDQFANSKKYIFLHYVLFSNLFSLSVYPITEKLLQKTQKVTS